MTEAERQEFKAMATDVAILKHPNEKIIEPSLRDINDTTLPAPSTSAPLLKIIGVL